VSPAPSHATDRGVTGTVVQIQHFSTHDGPGIRTTVFLKGCSLRCKWCCNPETIAPRPELAFDAARCIGVQACGRCLPACPQQAIRVADDGKVRIDWDRCNDCLRCVDACPSKSLGRYGRTMSVDEVLADVERDEAFHASSGGGLTLSGGECLSQPEFSALLLATARRRGVHTAIETAGNVPWHAMARVLPHVDTMLHDYKLSDRAAHRRWVGADNVTILANYRRAYTEFPNIEFIARIPLISGVNDDDAHIEAVLDAIEPFPNVVALDLLPYHDYGDSKYRFLGCPERLSPFSPPAAERVRELRQRIARRLGQRRPHAADIE
jgi:pyruvate formate lyase activating enzyme